MGDYSMNNNLAFVSGALILAVPLFDLLYVILLRLIKKKSPFFGSPDHFSLRLQKKYNLTIAKTVSVILVVQIVLCAVVVINFYATEIFTMVSTSIIVIFFLVFGVVLARVKME
jgi:hypothetical protein